MSVAYCKLWAMFLLSAVCQHADVRLVGTVAYSGRVEICFTETWGTVCDNMWSNDDANIVCRPQLFINYKLKSVAHLPWRMLTYKALNTFIDDMFAFVIKMPTMYRIGCFRDGGCGL